MTAFRSRRVAKCVHKCVSRAHKNKNVSKTVQNAAPLQEQKKEAENSPKKRRSRSTVWRRATGVPCARVEKQEILDCVVKEVTEQLQLRPKTRINRKRFVDATAVADALSSALGCVVQYKTIQRSFRRVFQGKKPSRKKSIGSENEEDLSQISAVYR